MILRELAGFSYHGTRYIEPNQCKTIVPIVYKRIRQIQCRTIVPIVPKRLGQLFYKFRAASTLLLALLFSLFFEDSFSNASELAANEIYSVMTYNIRYANPGDKEDQWINRKEAVIGAIVGSDIVGLQEVLKTQQENIESKTPGWQWWAVGRDDGQQRGEMCSVGWRTEKFTAVEQGTFWLSPDPLRIGKAGWDAALPRIATWVRLIPRSSAISLLVVNTHFDHRGAEARRRSAALLRQWIADHCEDSEVILMGDLNAKLGSPPLDELLQAELSQVSALKDARSHSLSPDSGPDSTWNGFQEIVVGQRIDHIMYFGDRISILRCQTLDPRTESNRFASDHLPVMVEFSLAQ